MHNLSSALMQTMAIHAGRLHPESRPVPVPKPGEVLLRVAYAGVNRADLFQVQGSYPAPEDGSDLPGLEVSGTIAALGNGVTGWQLGDTVCALTNGGGYAEYVTVPTSHLLSTGALSLADAAALPEALATAAMALLLEAQLRADEQVLIHGGASGIGVILIQVARALGAEVYATASPAKHALLQELGATPLSYDLTGPEPFDVILDTLGGPRLTQHIKLLRKGGRLVTIACLEGSKGELPMGAMLLKHLRVSGVTLRSQSAENKEKIMQTLRETLWPRVATGTIRPVLDQVFPLKDAEKAHQRMENRLNLGKMVLEV